MPSYWRTVRNFNRDTWLYLATWALIGFAFFGVQNVLMNLYLTRLGYGPEFIGSMNGLGQLVWAISALPAGRVGARLGLRNAVVLGHLLVGTASGLYLLVEGLPGNLRPAWLFGCSALLWLGASLNTVNGIPYLMGITGPEERNHAFGMQQVALSSMAFVGSILAGVIPGLFASLSHTSLDQAAPYRLALWFAPPTYLLSTLLMAAARPVRLAERKPSVSNRGGTAPLAFFLFLGLVIFLQSASAGTGFFFNLYLDSGLRVPIAQIGSVMGVAQLLPVLAALLAPVFLARWGAGRTLTWMSLGIALAIVPLASIPHWAAAAAGLTSMNAILAILGPARSLFSQEMVAPQWRTTTSALVTIGLALGWSAASAAGGFLIGRVGFQGFFWAGCGLALASTLLLLGYFRWRPVPAT